MDQRWFLTIGVLLICGIYVLVGSEQQQSRFDIWLDRHNSEATAEANALRPLIKCVNVADVPWRLDREAGPSDRNEDFPYLQRHDYQAITRDFCKPGSTFKSSLVDGTKRIGGLANSYIPTLAKALKPGMLEVLTDKSQLGRMVPMIAELDRKQHAESVQELLPVSETFRHELESTDIALRSRQLEQLEKKLGQDMHWHLLNYMMQARLTINRLDEAAHQRQLAPSLLDTTSNELRQAREAAQAYRDTLPANRRHGPVHELWSMLEQPMQQYQTALEKLATDWHNHADPQVLSDDFWDVGRRYDILLALYNKQADVDF